MDKTQEIINQINNIREQRNWKQFHNFKDVSLSLVLESTEVMEHFQWKSEEEIENYIKTNKNDIAEEMADVFYWLLLMSHDLDIDLIEATKEKLKKIEKKYPVEKSKGNHKKYTEL